MSPSPAKVRGWMGSAVESWVRGDNRTTTSPPAKVDRAHHLTTDGGIRSRVHVVTEPITDYLAYELCWEYGPHTAAGEDIRIIPVTDRWPDDVPQSDYTLFDSRRLFRLNYAPDGTWLGAQQVTDSASVVAACAARDAALYHAVPWAEYMTRHPDLIRRLPRGT